MCLLGWREATGASRPLFHSFTFLVSTPRLFPALQAMAIASQAAKGNPPSPLFQDFSPRELRGHSIPTLCTGKEAQLSGIWCQLSQPQDWSLGSQG